MSHVVNYTIDKQPETSLMPPFTASSYRGGPSIRLQFIVEKDAVGIDARSAHIINAVAISGKGQCRTSAREVWKIVTTPLFTGTLSSAWPPRRAGIRNISHEQTIQDRAALPASRSIAAPVTCVRFSKTRSSLSKQSD